MWGRDLIFFVLFLFQRFIWLEVTSISFNQVSPFSFHHSLFLCRWRQGCCHKSNSKCYKNLGETCIKGGFGETYPVSWWSIYCISDWPIFFIFSVRGQTSTLSHTSSSTCPRGCTTPTTGALRIFTCWWKGSGTWPGTVPPLYANILSEHPLFYRIHRDIVHTFCLHICWHIKTCLNVSGEGNLDKFQTVKVDLQCSALHARLDIDLNFELRLNVPKSACFFR